MDNNLKQKLWDIYKAFGQEALTLTHYDLANNTDYSAETWRNFLLEPDVKSWIEAEVSAIKFVEKTKIISGASTSRSTGQAQLLAALGKEDTSVKSGPAFIYTYVPLNEEQDLGASEHREDARVEKLEKDPFTRQIKVDKNTSNDKIEEPNDEIEKIWR